MLYRIEIVTESGLIPSPLSASLRQQPLLVIVFLESLLVLDQVLIEVNRLMSFKTFLGASFVYGRIQPENFIGFPPIELPDEDEDLGILIHAIVREVRRQRDQLNSRPRPCPPMTRPPAL